MDIDEIRKSQIDLHDLKKVDDVYTFYYDETNNERKIHLTPDGLNVPELKVFVLGGVVHKGPPRTLDLTSLRTAMGIQASAQEIKFKHVAKGDFLTILTSQKLTRFLEWLQQQSLMIHYMQLDPLYWSIVDIIDAIIVDPSMRHLIRNHAILKADLLEIIRHHRSDSFALLRDYDYPDISASRSRAFMEALIELLERDEALLPVFNFQMLKGVLQAGRAIDDLSFIQNDTPHILIEQFGHFYCSRIAIFRNAQHILDEESLVEDHFRADPLTSGGQPVSNYRFANSVAEPGVQLSDITVGLLGKLHTCLTETSADQVAQDRDALDDRSARNAKLLRDLISSSHSESATFLHHVGSVADNDKLDRFLRFPDGQYS